MKVMRMTNFASFINASLAVSEGMSLTQKTQDTELFQPP